MCVCVCVCVCARARPCIHACVCAYVFMLAYVSVPVCLDKAKEVHYKSETDKNRKPSACKLSITINKGRRSGGGVRLGGVGVGYICARRNNENLFSACDPESMTVLLCAF